MSRRIVVQLVERVRADVAGGRAVLGRSVRVRLGRGVLVEGGGGFRLLPRPPGLQRRDRSLDDGQPRVWRVSGDGVEAVPVEIGPTDGRVTVLRSGNLTAGAPVIVDLATRN